MQQVTSPAESLVSWQPCEKKPDGIWVPKPKHARYLRQPYLPGNPSISAAAAGSQPEY